VPRNGHRTRADRVKAHLLTHEGRPHCIVCIAAATTLSLDAVRAASMSVRGFPGIAQADAACAICGKTRLVLTAVVRLRDEASVVRIPDAPRARAR
jgi:hypothetical protein